MRTQLLVLLVGAFILTSCDPLQVTEELFCMNRVEKGEDPRFGEMSALLNGEPWPVFPWRSYLYASTNEERETMDIGISVLSERSQDAYPVGSMYFPDVPRRLGIYPLPIPGEKDAVPLSYFYHSWEYGDVAEPDYLLDISEAPFISINTYAPSSCTIQGTFALTVIREKPRDMHRNLDTLRFSEGRFYTHVVTRIR